MGSIVSISGMQILDSRGNPTIQASVVSKKAVGMANVPSGASTGKHEACELRDHGKAYGGKSVIKAVSHLRTIERSLCGMDVCDQFAIDNQLLALDGTANKRRLGANALLAVSMAAARCAAAEKGVPLHAYIAKLARCKRPYMPIPFANVLNGGKHAQGGLAIQEIMVAPLKARSFAEATRMVCEIYARLRTEIAKRYGGQYTLVGDEGGFAPPCKRAEEALDLLTEIIAGCGYTGKVAFAIDAAASEFFDKGIYLLHKPMSGRKLGAYYQQLINSYPIISIEDPFAEDDFESWQDFRPGVRVIGDDMLVTQISRMELAAKGRLCDGLLLKMNQVGTVMESLQAFQAAKKSDWTVMVSHRSGETEDSFIADLAVGLGCGQIKLGAPCRSERTAKYNRLLAIEKESGFTYARKR